MRNEKTNTTDEFLVKKRNPLVLPPNYEEIPEPGSILKMKKAKKKNKKNFKCAKIREFSNTKSSSVEESILNSIRK